MISVFYDLRRFSRLILAGDNHAGECREEGSQQDKDGVHLVTGT